jgi:hypothetical protein
MAQGLFRYDAEFREFRTREPARPWIVEEGGGVTILDTDEGSISSETERRRRPAQGATKGGIEADPTPIRRRRKHSHRTTARIETAVYGRGWRIALWVLIALMTVAWVGMIFSYVYNDDSSSEEDPFDFFSDDPVEG